MTAHCRPEHAQRHSRVTAVTDRSAGSSVTTSLTDDEHRAFEADAKSRNLSKAALMRMLIQDHLDQQHRPT